jgi:DNA mismatch repair protein MutS2
MIYPDHIEDKIDFGAIRRLLINCCISELGKEKVYQMAFSTDYDRIVLLLKQTDEMMRILQNDGKELPVGDFFDVRPALARVKVEGLFLDESEVFGLWKALEAVRLLVAFVQQLDEGLYPTIRELLKGVDTLPAITKKIEQILNKFGKMKDSASSELTRIRRDMVTVQGRIAGTLNSILKQAKADGYVEKDVNPTMREGRLVIPVSPAFKRKINGILHDESSTGKTVYIEPAQVVEANNRVRELEGEERREMIRILAAFTDAIRPEFDRILTSQYFLGEIDFLRAKALFSITIRAIKPVVAPQCVLEWHGATHPLLFLSLKKQGKEIAPLDIRLNSEQRILLISGPNAGGKSVCLKTVVLLQYMLQCGLPVPVRESSVSGIFERIFIDIGDDQSIENDLSTYSSHLLNMKFFIKNSNAKTLLLIDEFGTGTEPQIGGAIAEACLERFNGNKSFGVITTHYTGLKHFAEEAEGIVNGAMLYDRQHLQPLFQLSIGRPGSSFAIEIARKTGLPEDLIADASNKVGVEQLDFDKHLQDIVRDKRYWENKRRQIRQKEKKLNETLEKYETELNSIDKQRKDMLSKAKTEAQSLLSEANAKIENTIRIIKESEAEKERTKTVRRELRAFKDSISNEDAGQSCADKSAGKQLKAKKKQLHDSCQHPEKFATGDTVRLKGENVVGTILELHDRQAVVVFGALKSTVKLSQIERCGKSQPKNEARKYGHPSSGSSDEVRRRKMNFRTEIDVRGMRGDEALQAVTYFIDDAVMVGIGSVRILHGTGTGALRQLIRQYLAAVADVKHYHDEHVQFGGTGITVVEFE